MKQISGKNNEIELHFANGVQEKILSSDSAKWVDILNNSNIVMEGEGNRICLKFESETDAQSLLTNPGFNILVIGNNNTMNIGKGLSVGYNPAWSMMGLHLIIGTPIDHWSAPNTSRATNDCQMDIGEHLMACGAMIYLQDDGSHIRIGNECMISWGVNIWNTDAHSIIDTEGKAQNIGKFIEIGNHVWVGRDVKIGKNVRIANDSIIGWGSIVTKSFEEPNVIIGGIPAKIIKQGINWNGRTASEYNRFINSPVVCAM